MSRACEPVFRRGRGMRHAPRRCGAHRSDRSALNPPGHHLVCPGRPRGRGEQRDRRRPILANSASRSPPTELLDRSFIRAPPGLGVELPRAPGGGNQPVGAERLTMHGALAHHISVVRRCATPAWSDDGWAPAVIARSATAL